MEKNTRYTHKCVCLSIPSDRLVCNGALILTSFVEGLQVIGIDVARAVERHKGRQRCKSITKL